MSDFNHIYDRVANKYDRWLGPFERRFLAAWRREALSYLPEDARILEIGAGTGLNFEFYPKKCVGRATDISLNMLKLAAGRVGPKTIDLVQADAQKMPFADRSFDAAFATLVFCSIPDPKSAFEEIKRLLKPGGLIVLLEHVRPTGLKGAIFDLLNIFSVALIEDHINRRTAETVKNAGFEILEIKSKAFGIVNLIVCRNHHGDL